MRSRSWSCLALATALLIAIVSVTQAQGTARSLNIDTSIRAAGMGGASAAVWWGEPGVWGNPASLAGVRGVGWIDGRTRLVPGLDANVWLKSSRLLLGGAGVGVSFIGDPIEWLGHLRLDYGLHEDTDPFGNPIGTVHPYERTEAWGVGRGSVAAAAARSHPRCSERTGPAA